MSTTPAFDVIVVGFGPTGATLAAQLGLRGVRVLVIDRAPGIYQKPRAFALDHEVQRIFQNIGVMRAIEAYIAPFTDSEYYGADGQLIKRFANMAPPYPQGYVPSVVFTQPPVEAALRARVRAIPGVTVRLSVTFIGFEPTLDGVAVRLRTDDGAIEPVLARYLVGADGASSTVRQLAGIELDDLAFDEPWLVVDVRVNEHGTAKLPKVCLQCCEPERPATYLIGVGNHRRWEIMLNPDEAAIEHLSDAQVWSLLSRWITPADGELWRHASYRFHALVARQWRNGAVFVAGDAAHQQPPFTGQGMCQGVRDATNLGWKLAAVMHGRAGPALLDTYAAERSRHVTHLTSVIKQIGQLICERDLVRARARDAALIAAAGGAIPTTTRQELIPPLEAGLIADDGHAANGRLFPQPRITPDGRLLDEIAAPGWRIVSVNADVRADHCIDQQMDVRDVTIGPAGLREADGVVAAWFDRFQCTAAIVRPDHYVYGVATDCASLTQQLDQLAIRLQ